MTDKLESMGEGRKIVRGVDGRIERMVLTSEAASSMAKSRFAKGRDNTTTSSQLLAEAGFNNTNQAPEHLRLLSELASSGRSGAVPALRDFRRLTRVEASEPGGLARPQPGEQCPLCGQWNNWGLDGRGISELVRMIRDVDAVEA